MASFGGPDFTELVARVEALEERKLALRDLPLAPLQRRLESDWQPSAPILLGENSITTPMLVDGAVTPSKVTVPKFRVYRAAALSLANNAIVTFDTEELDSHKWFDSATGTFTPQQAGTYRFAWSVRPNAALTVDTFWTTYLQKNGTQTRGGTIGYQRGAAAINSAGCAQLDANGTTDSFTIAVQYNAAGPIAIQASSLFTFFDAEFTG